MLRDKEKRAQARSAQQDNDSTSSSSSSPEGYFTYRPLSNLPTPPPSSRTSSAAQSPSFSPLDSQQLCPLYKGAAIHLVNLIPASASLTLVPIISVQAILTRANLPLETVALAVCLLDSLDSRFARTWRLTCPLWTSSSSGGRESSATQKPTPKRHSLPPPSPLPHRSQSHIDSVSPAVIVLAALVIAVKFTQDPETSTQFYCREWGRDLWSCHQLNVTERCIMEKLNYRIMPLCEDEYISGAMADMRMAAQHYDWDRQRRLSSAPMMTTPSSRAGGDDTLSPDSFVPSHSRSKTMGTAIGLGLLTPLETSGEVS